MELTIISVIVIIAAFIAAWVYVLFCAKKQLLIEKRRWIEQLPSLISTLGVLGTFLGITIGLLNFNSKNLDASIPLLLDGLKTSFFTSLAGMVGSLFLSRTVSRIYDNLDKGTSDINIAAAQITQAVNQMCQTIVQNTQQQTNVQSAFYNTVNQTLAQLLQAQTQVQNNTTQLLTLQTSLNTDTQSINGSISQLLTLQSSQTSDVSAIVKANQKSNELLKISKEHLGTLADAAKETNDLLTATKENVSTINEAAAESNRNIGEIANISEGLASVQNEIADEVKSFAGKLHGEVIEIEESMEKTNELLTKKFDEFSKLLEKSNTEALVEVMKKVTEEFNRQMSELINKLVQENFEQLNKSVEQLNSWQQENKEMIQSLTEQYKAMEKDFEATSTTLVNVGEDTKALVSDGGKLQKIVSALNAVMVEDKRFVEMVTNLNAAAELNKTSMTEFKDAQSSLNDWVKKQRNFVDAVQALIKQLEDISKINDYSQEFWKQTRSGMNDSLNIIQNGSRSLMEQIQNLDGHFYNRLNATLANLDQCIQKMIDNN